MHSLHVIAIANVKLYPEEGEPWILEYFLRTTHGPKGGLAYGIRVDKRRIDGALLEREETPGITSSLDDATKLAKIFAQGTVPPCVLHEMVDECQELFLPPCEHATWKQYVTMGT